MTNLPNWQDLAPAATYLIEGKYESSLSNCQAFRLFAGFENDGEMGRMNIGGGGNCGNGADRGPARLLRRQERLYVPRRRSFEGLACGNPRSAVGKIARLPVHSMMAPARSKATKRSRNSMHVFEKTGAPEEIRTPDPQIRSLVLYPAELRARRPFDGGRPDPPMIGRPDATRSLQAGRANCKRFAERFSPTAPRRPNGGARRVRHRAPRADRE